MRLFPVFLLSAAALIAQDKKVELGRYLVENAGACGYCHTPRNAQGELDRGKWLKGMVLEFAPIGTPPANWHKSAPDLTPSGKLWAKWGEGAMIKFLQTGLTPSGKPAGPPMPVYKYSAEHAEAVLAYLKTLK
jgi:hypothetical protein